MQTGVAPKTILKVRKLNLVFQVDTHRPWTLKEYFTRLATDPFETLNPEKDRLQVANDISFDAVEGERVGILGVNGAGKTSLCRCIAGMFRPTSGTIEVDGPIRAVFNAQVGIQPELTGRENSELLVHFLFPGVSKIQAKEIVEEALEFSDLGRFADTPYRIYSNGMQVRLILSLVSSKPTSLLILDEVFDGADSFFREKIAVRVEKMIKESGVALFVSHSADQIRKVCTRVVVLDRARICFDGEPNEAIKFYHELGSARP